MDLFTDDEVEEYNRLLRRYRGLKNIAEEALHLLETPGDFTDHERLCVIQDLDTALHEIPEWR